MTRSIPLAIEHNFVQNNAGFRMTGAGGQSIRVRHKEIVAMTTTSGATTPTAPGVVKYSVNPGCDDTFPWLSQIANAYERYSVNSIEFEWQGTMAATVPGIVGLVPDYDPTDTAPNNMAEALSNADSASTSPFGTARAVLRQIDHKRKYFTRRAAALQADLRETDCANLFVLNSIVVAGGLQTSGKLSVKYDITFYQPQTEPDLSGNAQMANATGQLGAIISGSTAAEVIRQGLPAFINQAVQVGGPRAGLYNYEMRQGIYQFMTRGVGGMTAVQNAIVDRIGSLGNWTYDQVRPQGPGNMIIGPSSAPIESCGLDCKDIGASAFTIPSGP